MEATDGVCISGLGNFYMNHDFRQISVWLPVSLHARARVLSRRLRLSLSHLIREGLAEKIAAIEGAEQERKAAKAAKQVPAIERKQLNRLGETVKAPELRTLPSLSPIESSVAAELEEKKKSVTTEEQDPLFEYHLKRVIEAAHDPTEKRLRIREAVVDFKNKFPHSSPNETELVLEFGDECDKAIASSRAQASIPATLPFAGPLPTAPIARSGPPAMSRSAPVRFDDGLTGKTIDPNSIKSRGDVVFDDVADEPKQS